MSEAPTVRSEIGAPDGSDWSPGPASDTALVIVQVNVAEPVAPEPSVAVRATEHVQAVVGVPLIVPVAWSIDSPAGRPVVDQVSVAPDCESVAEPETGVMAAPDGSDRSPGPVTDTALVMFQVNEAESEYAASSVTVTVTDELPGVVGVPVMLPVELSIERPAGRPVAP